MVLQGDNGHSSLRAIAEELTARGIRTRACNVDAYIHRASEPQLNSYTQREH
jgi:hypothetical protein